MYLVASKVFRIAGATAACRPDAALLAALLFAIHPLRVESVAWATERRDVLSAFFLLVSFLAWLGLRAPEASAHHAPGRWYFVALLSFVLSLLSKAWGITFPAVLLVLDAWPLRRFERGSPGYAPPGRLLLEKLPFAALALPAAILAALAQRSTGSMPGLAEFSPWQRVMLAGYGLCFYLRKSLWPTRLSPIYLFDPNLDPAEPVFVFSAVLVVAAAVLLWVLRRRWPAGIAAFLCYAVLASPVLGLAQTGIQIAADRYSYVSCIPLSLLVGAGFGRQPSATATGKGLGALAFGLLATLGVLTWRQTFIWRDSLALWNQVIALEPDHWYALQARGHAWVEAGDLHRALTDLDAAIPLNPRFPNSYLNRGSVRAALGDVEGAIGDWNRAVALNPRLVEAYIKRGMMRLMRLGDPTGAVGDFREALRLEPTSYLAWYDLATAYERLDRLDAAIDSYRRALAAAPSQWGGRKAVEQALAELEARRRRAS